MNRRRFRIPVGFPGKSPTHKRTLYGYDTLEHLWSDTLVIPLPQAPSYIYEVQRVHGAWSPHVPEKKPTYRVTQRYTSFFGRPRSESRTIEMCRLTQVQELFLVELDVRRPQMCVTRKGLRHSIIWAQDLNHPWTSCGEEYWVDLDTSDAIEAGSIPNCPKCIALETVWTCFQVYPYEDKRVVIARSNKNAHKIKLYLRKPTAFDRVLEDFLDAPPKSIPTHTKPPEEDEFAVYDQDAREDRLAAARDRNQRIKSAKKEMKGY